MYPLIQGPFIHLSAHHPSILSYTIHPTTGPLIHSSIIVLSYAPNHPFLLPAIYSFLSYLPICISISPIHIHPPIHSPLTLLLLIYSHTTCLSIFTSTHSFTCLTIHTLATYSPTHPHTIDLIHTPSTHPQIHQYISLSTSQMVPTHSRIHPTNCLPTIHPPIYLSPHHPSLTFPSIHLHTTYSPTCSSIWLYTQL